MNNAMMQLNLYKEGYTWKFDDIHNDIKAEPFVLGMSEMIDYYVDDSDCMNATLLFSGNKFPTCNMLQLLEEDSHGGWYKDVASERVVWLCPVTRVYMQTIPEAIYFLVQKNENEEIEFAAETVRSKMITTLKSVFTNSSFLRRKIID